MEYPNNFIASYAKDLLKMFAEFQAKFGGRYGQLANMGVGDDSRVYPYLWGVFREGMNAPAGVPSFTLIDSALEDSLKGGVKANLIGSYWPNKRWDMSALAFYYIIRNDTCYFMPFLSYVSDEWASDPRKNQWFEATAYDIGAAKGPRQVLMSGLDPASVAKDTFNATVTNTTATVYRLTDASKQWPEKRFNNAWVLFPSGYICKAYKTGPNWVELYKRERGTKGRRLSDRHLHLQRPQP